jgi:membrane associated rhomboid family serine protease
MGTSDRDYARQRPVAAPLPLVTKWLIIVNIGIFLADMFLKKKGTSIGPIADKWVFTVQSALYEGRYWEFFTFQFIHANLGHVVFNCVGIYFFGPWMERWWGTIRFLCFYLLCGAAGGVFYSLLLNLGILPDRGPDPGIIIPLMGASAGIYGMMIGVAALAPNVTVQLLFPPISLTMRQFAYTVVLLAIGVIAGDNFLGWNLFENSGGEAGHLGGAIFGFMLIKLPFLLGKPRDLPLHSAVRPRTTPAWDAKLRPRTSLDLEAATEIDRILDKISLHGFQSLTDEERDLLREASENHPS